MSLLKSCSDCRSPASASLRICARSSSRRLSSCFSSSCALIEADFANAISHGYDEWAGAITTRNNGSIVADRAGVVTPFAIIALQERMTFFVNPTEEVYEGMVIGENSRTDDMDVNITKEKKLTNMRSSTADTFESMTPSRQLTLEECLEFAREDECVEVTPEKVRIRKVILDQTTRGRAAARAKKA